MFLPLPNYCCFRNGSDSSQRRISAVLSLASLRQLVCLSTLSTDRHSSFVQLPVCLAENYELHHWNVYIFPSSFSAKQCFTAKRQLFNIMVANPGLEILLWTIGILVQSWSSCYSANPALANTSPFYFLVLNISTATGEAEQSQTFYCESLFS